MQKILPSNSRLAASPKAPEAKKGTILVRCTNHPKLAYELLVKFIDGKAIIGGKRSVKIDFSAKGTGASTSDLSGEIERINGITWGCLHCENDWIISCGLCRAWSCEVKGAVVSTPCPYCGNWGGVAEPITNISATPKAQNSGQALKPTTTKKTAPAVQGSNVKRLK